MLSQVREVFSAKKKKPGAAAAAEELGIGLASFYNYANGKTLPDMEVLKKAVEIWKVKWEYLDPAEILRMKKVETPKQYVLSFLEEVRAEDIEVVEVRPKGPTTLHVALKIRFSA